jgi:hypothetical protein
MSPASPHHLPHGNTVWIVRWVKRSGHVCNHRMYVRSYPAYSLAAALRLARWDVAVYRTRADWQLVPMTDWMHHRPKGGTP